MDRQVRSKFGKFGKFGKSKFGKIAGGCPRSVVESLKKREQGPWTGFGWGAEWGERGGYTSR